MKIKDSKLEIFDYLFQVPMSVDPWTPMLKQGLYDPSNEHEACGVGFIVAIDGTRCNKVKTVNKTKKLIF